MGALHSLHHHCFGARTAPRSSATSSRACLRQSHDSRNPPGDGRFPRRGARQDGYFDVGRVGGWRRKKASCTTAARLQAEVRDRDPKMELHIGPIEVHMNEFITPPWVENPT